MTEQTIDNLIGNSTISVNITNMAKESLQHCRYANIEKWHTDSKHNTLYITGISGSGKSTVTIAISSSVVNANFIELDSYFNLDNNILVDKLKSSDFNEFLLDHNFKPNTLNDKNMFENNIKKYFKLVHEFEHLIDLYSKDLYDLGFALIVEGVQILDKTLYKDGVEHIKNKPFIILDISEDIAIDRATNRDCNR